MDKPKTVTSAQNLIYGTLGVGAICAFFNTVAGPILMPEFLANTVTAAILAIIPFFIGRGSNIARYLYVLVTVASALIILASSEMVQNSGRFDLYVSVLLMPVELYVCGMLFRKESREWFAAKPKKAT